MGARPHGAAEFADGSDVADAFEAFVRATEFVIHEREFEAKGRRFGVDSVAATNAGRQHVLLRPAGDDLAQFLHLGDEEVRALDHLHGEGGIDDVAAGEAEVEPSARRVVDPLGDGGGEADDVMVEGLFEFLLAFDQLRWMAVKVVRAGFDPLEVGLGHDAFVDERLGDEEFDLQPDPELVFVGPDGAHGRTRIPLNHGPKVGCRESRVECGVQPPR